MASGAYDLGAADLAALMDGLPLVLEIGSGMGEATIAMASAEPSVGVIAAEVHTRGLARLLRAAHDAGLRWLRDQLLEIAAAAP